MSKPRPKPPASSKDLALITQAQSFPALTSDRDYEKAGVLREDLKALEKEIKSTFRPIIQAAKAAHTEALEKEKSHLKPVSDAREKLERVMGEYLAEKRRLEEAAAEKARRELERRAKLTKDETRREVLLAKSEAVQVQDSSPALDSTGVRETWDVEVVDEALIPDEFILRTPNLAVLKAKARAEKNKFSVPGVKAFPRTGFYSR